MLCGRPAADERVAKLIEILQKNPPAWEDGRGPVYWHLATCAMYKCADEAKWKKWAGAVRDMLLPRQREGGCSDGSWDPVGPEATTLGRIGVTALNQLTVKLSYRFIEKEPRREGRE
jgi:hypothetical protein